MNSRIRFLALTTILSLLAGRMQAQQTGPAGKPTKASEHTDDRGLLLGVYFPAAGTNWDSVSNPSPDMKWVPEISDEPHGQYLTFWVSKSGDSVKIQIIKGLLVPRGSGFWRIGSRVVKSTDSASNYDEWFWAVPVSEKPQMSETDPSIDGRSVRLLTYAGADYLSYLLHWQGGAGAWEYVYPRVAAIDAPTKDKTLEQVLGTAINASYKRKAKLLDHTNKEPQEGEACNCCTGREDEWGIIHAGDHWQAFARFHYGTSSSCSQDSTDDVLATSLPKRLASGGSLGRPWEVLRHEEETIMKTEPGSVRHLFVSPKQDLLVALSTHGLAVLGVEDLHIRSVLKVQEFDAACIPVMEQWSLGRFVSGWDAVIQKEQTAEIPNTENP